MNEELNDIVLLRTAEAARLLHISVKTVNRWTDKGILPCKVRTLGGHRRYDEREVRKLQWLLRQGKGRPKRGRPRRDRVAAQPLGLNGSMNGAGLPGMPDANGGGRVGVGLGVGVNHGNGLGPGNGFRPAGSNGTLARPLGR
jgi:excisionase family DNA binding protein